MVNGLITISIKVNVPTLHNRSCEEQGTCDEEAYPADPLGFLELASRRW